MDGTSRGKSMKVQQALLLLFVLIFSCHLCNMLFRRVLISSCFVLSFLNFKFVYVLLKMGLIVLYIHDLLCHCVILTCVIQTFHQANTFNWFK